VTGAPEPLDEIVDARYWTVDEFEASEATLGDGTNVPEAHAKLAWWVEKGRNALKRAE
jgi:hypothetical protein